MNTHSPTMRPRSRSLLLAVAAAIVMGIGTYWLLQWFSRTPVGLGPVQLPLAVILMLGGAAYLISCVRAATRGLEAAWARPLPLVAPVLVLGVIGVVWSDRRSEPTISETLDQPIAATPSTQARPPTPTMPAMPVAQDSQRNEAELHPPPIAPVPASELVEPKYGEPVDR